MALLIGYITDNLISKYKWARGFTSRWKNIYNFPGRGYLIKFFYSDTHTSIAG